MANIKFSQFTVGNTQSDIDFVVGYKGPDNVQISPTNLLASSLGNYLPLAGGTMTGNLEIIDNIQLQMGNGLDFRLYHDAANSIMSSGTGDLYIQNTANDKDIIFRSDDGAGGLATYFSVDGGEEDTNFFKDTHHIDNVVAKFGSDSTGDLRIKHDATDSYIQNITGNLEITNNANDKDIIFRCDDGAGGLAEYFRIDGGVESIIFSKNTQHADNVKAYFGNAIDLAIYHDATNNIINGGSTGINIDTYGDINIGDLTVFNTYASGFKVDMTAARQGLYNFEEAEWQLYSTGNNDVFLLYGGNVKLETESYGIDVTGRIALNDGNNNVSVGDNAGQSITTGVQNILLGSLAGDALTTGSNNIAIGYRALSAEDGDGRNVAIGQDALFAQNAGANAFNVAIGFETGKSVTTGTNNTIIGGLAGDALTTGSFNTAFGFGALGSEDGNGRNVAVGYLALTAQNAGVDAYNVAVGFSAGAAITTGTGNVIAGGLAGDAITVGSGNIVLGFGALTNETHGRNIAIGYQALGDQNVGSDAYNTAVGYQAGTNVTSGIRNTILGGLAGDAITTANYNVAIGYGALSSEDTLNGNTAVGYNTLTAANGGSFNVALGYEAGDTLTTGDNNTILGTQAGDALTTGSNNIIIGYAAEASAVGASNEITLGDNNISLLRIPGLGSTDGHVLTYEAASGGIVLKAGGGGGASSLNDLSDVLIDGTSNYFVNIPAGLSGNPVDNLVIGNNAGNSLTDGFQNICIGADAGDAITTGDNNVCLGVEAGSSHTTNGNSVYIGYRAGVAANAGNSVVIGSRALDVLSGAWNNHCVIGEDACGATTSRNEHHAFGYEALRSQTTGERNSAFGAESLELLTTGVDNSAFGHNVGDKVTGDQNTLIGSSAGSSGTNDLTSGDANILIGYNSAASSATVSNEVNLYNGSVTARFQGAAAAWSFVSDARDKKDIKDLELGLDFVNKLKPRKFKWDLRDSDVDKNKEASGFIAQEVKEVLDEMENDYTGIVDTNNPDQYTVSQANIIPMLVKAIQELKAEIELLKSK